MTTTEQTEQVRSRLEVVMDERSAAHLKEFEAIASGLKGLEAMRASQILHSQIEAEAREVLAKEQAKAREATKQARDNAERLAGQMKAVFSDAFSRVAELANSLPAATSPRLTVIFERVEGKFQAQAVNVYTYQAPSKPRGAGTAKAGNGGGRGAAITVDGKEYPSAANARDMLHPERAGKQQSRTSIEAYLVKEGHTVS